MEGSQAAFVLTGLASAAAVTGKSGQSGYRLSVRGGVAVRGTLCADLHGLARAAGLSGQDKLRRAFEDLVASAGDARAGGWDQEGGLVVRKKKAWGGKLPGSGAAAKTRGLGSAGGGGKGMRGAMVGAREEDVGVGGNPPVHRRMWPASTIEEVCDERGGGAGSDNSL